MKTYVSTYLYPSDSETISLLGGLDEQYKWGGPAGTSTDLSFSFASNDTFRIDQAYQDSLEAYTTFYESGLNESIFYNPDYSFRTFTDSQKALIRESLDSWSDVTGINFIEIVESTNGNSYGDIRFFSQDFLNWATLDPFYEGVAGYAYLPYYDGWDDALEGDVFLDTYHLKQGSQFRLHREYIDK